MIEAQVTIQNSPLYAPGVVLSHSSQDPGLSGPPAGEAAEAAVAAPETAGIATSATETATQAALKGSGTIDRIIQTSAGPVRVYAEVTKEGSTAVVRDLAIYPEKSGSALNVGYSEMRQGLRGILNELKDAGFTDARIENAYRVSGANPGRTTTFTIKLK